MAERIVEVEWEDSSRVSDWHNEEDIPSLTPIRSWGLLYREDDDCVMLLQSRNESADGPGIRTARLAGSLVIPRSAIRKVTELRRGKR